MEAISNRGFLNTTRRRAAITSGWPLRMGFTNAGYTHGGLFVSSNGMLRPFVTVRGNAFIAKQNRLSPTALVFVTLGQIALGGLF